MEYIKRDKDLLIKYAVKQFGKDKAKKLLHTYKDRLFGENSLSKYIGSKSIEYFCLHFLQDTFIPKGNNKARKLAEVHYEIWELLESMFIEDKFDKLGAAINRGCAKTTVLDFALSVWAHCYEVSTYTLVCGSTEQDSVEFLAQTKQAFEENEYIMDTFGKLVDGKKFTVNKLELELSNKTKIQAISSASSPRGKKYNNQRPNIIIADDYQSRKDILTEASREKKYRAWIEDSGYAGDKAVWRDGKKISMETKFIVIGTILHEDCFMSRILANREYKTMLRKVVDFDVDEYFNNGLWGELKNIYFDNSLDDSKAHAIEFYYQNESEMKYTTIWDDKYNCVELAIDYYSDPVGFKQEMMNDARGIGEKFFHSQRTMPSEDIENHNFIKTMICADPKGTNNKNKKKEDYFACCVGSLADNGFKYVREGILKKIEYDEYISTIIDLLIKYEEVQHVYIEKNTYMGADVIKLAEVIREHPLLRRRNIEFINEMQKKNKDEKISTIIGDVDNGRIIFNAENEKYNGQVMEFRGQDYTLHDDAPDITAEFAIRIDDIEVTRKINVFDKKKVI